MPKWYHPDILDFGLDRPRERIAVGSKTLKLKLLKAYAAADSYATANGNSVGESAALVAGDFTLANQGTNGRQVTVTGKTFNASASTTQYDSGTATSGGATTLTDTGKSFTTNAHAGRALKHRRRHRQRPGAPHRQQHRDGDHRGHRLDAPTRMPPRSIRSWTISTSRC